MNTGRRGENPPADLRRKASLIHWHCLSGLTPNPGFFDMTVEMGFAPIFCF